MQQTLHTLSKACAVLAGALLVAVTLLTVAAVVGRELGRPITGDFELVAQAAGAVMALFLPWCQAERGHIMVDFFTAKASPQTTDALDRVGAVLMAAFVGLMTWRAAVGGLNAWTSNEGSMMLGFPSWITYAAMVPPMALAALVALHQAAFGFASAGDEANGATA